MALLWLKPLAARVVRKGESSAPAVDVPEAAKVRGIA
jgi:hypothetical protein